MKVFYSPTFVRQFQSLPAALQEEVVEKIAFFRNPAHHHRLRVHKLKGRLAGRFSFSVNYRTRIVFCYLRNQDQRSAVLLATGDHRVYDE